MAITITTVTEYHASVTVPKEFFWARYDDQGAEQPCIINTDELATLLFPQYALIYDRKRCIAWELQSGSIRNDDNDKCDTASFHTLADAELWANLIQSAYDTTLAELHSKYYESEGSKDLLTYWGLGELVAR
jgi:hypothetical protein